jgi:hypothetical protein
MQWYGIELRKFPVKAPIALTLSPPGPSSLSYPARDSEVECHEGPRKIFGPPATRKEYDHMSVII